MVQVRKKTRFADDEIAAQMLTRNVWGKVVVLCFRNREPSCQPRWLPGRSGFGLFGPSSLGLETRVRSLRGGGSTRTVEVQEMEETCLSKLRLELRR